MVNVSKWYNHLLNWQVETVCKSLFWHQYLQVEWIGELSSEKTDCRNQTGYEEYSRLIGCHDQSTPNKENNAGGLQNWETVKVNAWYFIYRIPMFTNLYEPDVRQKVLYSVHVIIASAAPSPNAAYIYWNNHLFRCVMYNV